MCSLSKPNPANRNDHPPIQINSQRRAPTAPMLRKENKFIWWAVRWCFNVNHLCNNNHYLIWGHKYIIVRFYCTTTKLGNYYAKCYPSISHFVNYVDISDEHYWTKKNNKQTCKHTAIWMFQTMQDQHLLIHISLKISEIVRIRYTRLLGSAPNTKC